MSNADSGNADSGNADPQLLALRQRIDVLDDELLQLMNERAAVARRVGEIKGEGPVYRPEREAQILRRLQAANPGPLPNEAVARIYTELISACRAVEALLAVAFLGPRGTFSEEAAARRFGSSIQAVPCGSIEEVFRQVEARQVEFGVVPVENSSEGAVGRTLDLLLATPALISGEVLLPVHHCLMGKAEAVSAVRRVYAHEQALGQCHEWLSQNLPRAERIAMVSNAEAARRAADQSDSAAIGSQTAAALYGLNVLAHNIEDNPSNTTRFAVIGHLAVPPSGRDKTSLVMSARNRPGAMHELLQPLADQGVSMSRLESRPSRTGMWEYVFFVDLEGHEEDPNVAAALDELRRRASFLKILGSYPAA